VSGRARFCPPSAEWAKSIARDTKLGRDVALKVVSDGFVHDPDRVARFQREAVV
jgi:serine/threonine protein kinase